MMQDLKKVALAGNRTPVSRVAGENSTTEPPMLHINVQAVLGPNYKAIVRVCIY